ncbi:MAG: hypothetical protein QOD51_809, partial [Candidatus Eremiobacteraeota bacterium]|nr:hypothetical protein [Candidatus Eremiobacteraeota bacterium]
MKRLAVIAVALGVATASCSGAGSVSSMLPANGVQMGGNMPAPSSKAGARSTRAVTSSVAAPSGWASTATQPFTFKSASDLGALDPGKTLTV